MARQAKIALAAAGALTLSGLAAGVGLPAGAAADSSARTVTVDTEPFKGLEITVAKTANLVNEVVEVSWKNGEPTEPIGGYQRNFLQIMQCWGDDPGPRPEQCQWGAGGYLEATPGTGDAVTSRQMRSTSLPVDPDDKHTPDPRTGAAFLQFEAADGRPPVGGQFDEFKVLFDAQSTNEKPAGRTRGDGTGQEFFEVQTSAEAPGLGCGQLVSAPGEPEVGRKCWLVVVPRGDREVDGTVRTDSDPVSSMQRLQTSPLSPTNWKHRVMFPLTFQPIGGSCPLGQRPLTILGQESATEAITRWQQSLCKATGEVFDFNQVPDDAARGSLGGPRPGLSITTRPLTEPPAGGDAVYAPIAVSGLGLAFNLDTQTSPEVDPPELAARAGQRITDLNLNARLVAKLLTHSYTAAVTVVPKEMEKNPFRLEEDPEFLALNPAMVGLNKFAANSISTVVTPLNPSDGTALIWQWIAGDPEARDFMAGKDDGHGMVVNRAFQGADLVRSDYPKLDQTCRPALPDGTGPLCVPDAFPYANDMHDAVRSANKGDNLARNSWNSQGIPPSYRKPDRPQGKGLRAVMAVTDTATAARYHLPMAKLRNAKGNFVAPEPQNILANIAALQPSGTPGVLAHDPNVDVADAYPLSVVSYAATVPAAVEDKARAAYARLIEYAAGPGQQPGVTPGSLPDGYAAMPDALVEAAKAVAGEIKSYAATTPTPGPEATPTPAPQTQQNQQPSSSSSGSTGSSGFTGSTGSTGSAGSSGTTSPGASPTPVADATATTPETTPQPTPTSTPVSPPRAITQAVVTAVTPAVPIGKARYALLWLVVAGTVAIGAAQAAPRLPGALQGERGR